MENEYKQKYIKYKTKYLERLNYLQQNGGGHEKNEKKNEKENEKKKQKGSEQHGAKHSKKANTENFFDLTSLPAYSSSSEEIA